VYNLLVNQGWEPENPGSLPPAIESATTDSVIAKADLAAMIQKHFQVEEGLAQELAGIFHMLMATNDNSYSAWTEWSAWSECLPHCGVRGRWKQRERFCVTSANLQCPGGRGHRVPCPRKPCSGRSAHVRLERKTNLMRFQMRSCTCGSFFSCYWSSHWLSSSLRLLSSSDGETFFFSR
jgi:hypothetical protein